MPSKLAQMFRLNPNMFPGVNPGAFNNEYNEAIEPGIERQREAAVLGDMDRRTSATMGADLEEANETRALRGMGFMGMNPRRQASDYSQQHELGLKMLPEQMKLEAAMHERMAGREFDATQKQLDRDNRSQIASGAQAGQTSRVDAQQAAITARAEQTRQEKRNPVSKLYNWLTGNVSKTPQAAAVPATEGNDGSGQVLMEDPDGIQRMVPASDVQKYLARGVRVVE